MAASSYMTKVETDSIWNFTFVTARYNAIGIRMAEILNFRVNKDATVQVTTAGSTPILEQISEECLIELIAASKTSTVDRPWDFIQANVMSFMTRKMRVWKEFLDDIAGIEGKLPNIKYSNLNSLLLNFKSLKNSTF